jgi:beta-galactosidase
MEDCMADHMHFGADYYPEHWETERWPIDAQLMREAGINTVRLAEFAWSRLEPCAAQFDFTWLDQAIDVLQAQGIEIILGTPTASPPAWLIQAHPEILPVNEDGQRAGLGMRRHYCPNQPAFHEASRRVVEAMALHYADHPAVIAWQIDNELGNIANGNRCHCDTCRSAFHDWLRRRYGSLDELNRRWGTVFWSQEYGEWEQIPVPARTVRAGAPGTAHNPALFLDYARFTSDSWIAYLRLHEEILRARCPQHRITHNMMGLFPFIDYAAMARDLDIVAWDNYPRLPVPWSRYGGDWDPAAVAMAHDLMRSIKGRTFWVMEQQAGPSGWGQLSPTPLPGELRLWTLQSVARGAEAIVYFRWRTCRVGTEQYWHGILPHHGAPGRRYREVRETGEHLRRLGDLVNAQPTGEVAILRSYDTLWAFEAQPTAEGLSYDDQIGRFYRALWDRNIITDLITEDRPLDAYTLLIVPCLFVVQEDLPERLRRWVEAGGTLVLTFRSGVKTGDNAVVNAPLPGALADLAGTAVVDYTALFTSGNGQPHGRDDGLELTLERETLRLATEVWMDELEPRGAQVLARYRGGPYHGAPAMTHHQVGRGHVLYVGTGLDAAGHAALCTVMLQVAGVAPGVHAPQRVEIVRRMHDDTAHWFVLNHNAGPLEVTLPSAGVDLLTGRQLPTTFTVGGLDAVVVCAQSNT